MGATSAGTLLVQGADDMTSTLDMNGKGGFEESNADAQVTLKNINVTNVQNTDGGLILLGVKENKNHTFAIEGIDNPEQIFMFTRRGCCHFPRCRSGYTRQQVDCRS